MPIKAFTGLLCTVFCLCAFSVQAQQSTNSSGGQANGTGGSVSYSVGQSFYQTHSSQTHSIATGVQQPFEISVVTAIENTQGNLLEFAAFPNPVIETLNLKTNLQDFSSLRLQLYDSTGKIIFSEAITANEMKLNMQGCHSGIYFLSVFENNQLLKSFKIIKN